MRSESEQIVLRRIPLRHPCDMKRVARLQALEGVQLADCKGRQLRLHYDVLRTNLAKLENQLGSVGLPPISGLAWHIKRAFYRYVDDNTRTASGSNKASCCSNPQDIYARRKRGQ